jgi:hypothetical protein
MLYALPYRYVVISTQYTRPPITVCMRLCSMISGEKLDVDEIQFLCEID